MRLYIRCILHIEDVIVCISGFGRGYDSVNDRADITIANETRLSLADRAILI